MAIGCRTPRNVDSRLDREMPRKIVWAWERPEDLRFLDPKEFGVAFLAQTIFLENDRVMPTKRRQPLDVSPGTYLIAVTRIETNKETERRPTLTNGMTTKVAEMILSTLELPNVRGIQVDFDAVSSERPFYTSLMTSLDLALHARRESMPADGPGTDGSGLPSDRHVSLTMTALASWCTGDAWFNDFPVDEAVPMVFQMGADQEKIKTYLRNGNDWREPLCRGSYGISMEEGRFEGMKEGRRTYYFKNSAWNAGDLHSMTMP